MTMTSSQAQPRRSCTERSRLSYREPDTESDIEIPTTHARLRSARINCQTPIYREDTTSIGEEIAPDNREGRPVHRSSRVNRVRRSQRTKISGSRRMVPTVPTELNSFKRQKLIHLRSTKIQRSTGSTLHSHREDTSSNEHAGCLTSQCALGNTTGSRSRGRFTSATLNARIPPWQTLEYRIIQRAIHYASQPLSVQWLLGVSTLSKSFRDAAMATLLWEPPLLPTRRAHGLIDLLRKDPSTLSLNYRTKIRSLDLEVKHLLINKSRIDIADLLRYTPLLSRLRIFHHHDEHVGKFHWAEPTFQHFGWSYGDIFEQLDEHGIRLKFFEWNGRFRDTLSAMQKSSTKSCMLSLEELSFVNFQFTTRQVSDKESIRDCMSFVFASSPCLKKLHFHKCNMLDSFMMENLPRRLETLEIVSCLSLTSEGVLAYLRGNSEKCLRELRFDGNQVMDLAFMPQLATLCPELEVLDIDLSYEDGSSYDDRDPLYDELLPHGSPTWPSTLQSIVVGPLRSLDVSDAEAFYTSLIDAAHLLPHLRVLSIKTILNDASWRDRAKLRSKWRPLFEKVFSVKNAKPLTTKTTSTLVTSTSKRLSHRVTKSTMSNQRKSMRLQEQEDLDLADDGNKPSRLHASETAYHGQNRCEIVEFELSDQRPAQEQFREDDFLDSEPSGDEEWTGRDRLAAHSTYAW